jgi:hypothetical protein
MAVEVASLVARLEADVRDFERGMRQAQTRLDQLEDQVRRGGRSAGSMGGAFGAMATQVKAAAGIAAAAFAADFVRDSISAASNLEESINAVNKVFGSASSSIETFGQVSAQAVGLSTREFNQLATVTGSMLTNLGFQQDAAGKETIRLTQRASDMASVFNTDVGTALSAINSALKGEANPIEQFGVKLNDAAVRARAVELGLAATTAEVDANAKATATLSLIYEQTNKTAGDFAQTSDSLANAQRRAAASMENAQARLGRVGLPVLAGFMDRFAEGLERIAGAQIVIGKEGKLDLGLDQATRQSVVFAEALKGLQDEMAAGTLGTEDLANSLLHMASNADLTNAEFNTLAAAAGLMPDQFGVFSESVLEQARAMGLSEDVIKELEAAMGATGDAAGDAADGVDDLTGETDDLRTATQKAADAQMQMIDALQAAADPVFRAVDAMQNYHETLARVDEDGQRTAEEQLELAKAILSAQGAASALTASNPEKGIMAIATALGISREAARELLVELGILDGKTVTTFIRSVVEGVVAADAVRERGMIGGKQHGGPFTAFQPMIVGEAGPEAVMFNRPGSIIPNHELGGIGGGGTENIVIQLTLDGRVLAETVVGADEWNRRRGL